VPRLWDDLLSDGDRAVIERAQFGRRVGIGSRPAVLVIDAQNYMVGPPAGSPHSYPSSCGTVGRDALARLAAMLDEVRARRIPVFYSRFELARDGSDIGVYGRKRDFLTTEGWCLEGSEGAQIAAVVQPAGDDVVLVKKKPSAFHGTPLLGQLIAAKVDTVIITGGSTSNCVRATAVEAASYNFRVIVVEDCVFDRLQICHQVTLFDIDRQYGDVLPAKDVLEALEAGSK
jgi:maleamate amidohydrolase